MTTACCLGGRAEKFRIAEILSKPQKARVGVFGNPSAARVRQESATVLHTPLVRSLVALMRSGGSASLFVVAPGTTPSSGAPTRAVSIQRGCIIAVDSNLPGERLGEVLVAQNRVDRGLMEVLAEEARRSGRLLGEQLVADGLLTATEIAAFLEEQARERFARMLVMSGELRSSVHAPARQMLRWPLGTSIVEAFRDRVAPDAILHLAAPLQDARLLVSVSDDRLTSLQLLPAELRAVRRLSLGEAPADLVRGAADPLALQRLFVALSALGLLH